MASIEQFGERTSLLVCPVEQRMKIHVKHVLLHSLQVNDFAGHEELPIGTPVCQLGSNSCQHGLRGPPFR